MSTPEKKDRSPASHMAGAPRPEGPPDLWQGSEGGALFRDAKGRLVLEMNGRVHEDLRSVRMFPVTDPDHWISLCDQEGQEVVCIEDLEALPESTRQLIVEDLQAREFIPVITRVMSISVAADPSEWHVKTDRGPTSFTLNDEDDIHRLSDFRILIIDSHGIRYLIPDIRQLDLSSRRILSHYI